MENYKAIYISDLHLGVTTWQVDILINFLKENKFDYIFLNGDIIDCWKLSRKFRWPQRYNKFIKLLFKLSKNTKIIYLIGNHEGKIEWLSDYNIGTIEIKEQYQFENILIMHGHQFDELVKNNIKLAKLGSIGYEWLLKFNGLYTWIRRNIFYCKSHWSLSSAIKKQVKNACKFISNFEDTLSFYAKQNNAQAIMCGHIHSPNIKKINNIIYFNSGDFVENLTLIVQTKKNKFKLIRFNHDFSYEILDSISLDKVFKS